MEIERKFLVKSDSYRQEAYVSNRIVQGFLSTDPHRTVRVRLYNDRGFITIKGISNKEGTSRQEWEFEISAEKAKELLELSVNSKIEKIRFLIQVGDHKFEVDEFEGDNAGLVIAEIELQEPDEKFLKPEWLGKEVTGDTRYYNAQLTKTPYNQWKQ